MTKIEWTDETWNPVSGCTKVSTGCKNCYAERVAQRFWKGRKFTEVQMHADRLDQPLRWRKPRRVFVNSMSDLFHEAVPDEFIDEVFSIMMAAPKHTFQVLTKRPGRARAYMKLRAGALLEPHGDVGQRLFDLRAALDSTREWPPRNVWLGVSCEDQQRADQRIPQLLDTPAAVRFLSCEPLLAPIEFSDVTKRSDAVQQLGKPALAGIDWVIVGGESGAGARPCYVAWIRSIVEQCKAAGVACFVKQLGAVPRGGPWALMDSKGGDPAEWPEDLRVRQWPRDHGLHR